MTNCMLLFVAGHETTTNLIGNGTLALLRNRDQLDRCAPTRADRGRAVEELLRYDGPVQLTGAHGDGGRRGRRAVGRGRRRAAHVLLAAANRDPAASPTRTGSTSAAPTTATSPSRGIHYCLGAALARLEGQVALSALVTRFPRLELTVDELEWNPTTTLRGLRALPLSVSTRCCGERDAAVTDVRGSSGEQH